MNWIIKDTKIGYKYTTNNNTRKIILDYFNNYLYNLILSNSKSDDTLYIIGLFSNTNPSIIAIKDAHDVLLKLSKIIKIVLIKTDNDIRTFDGENFSALDMFNYMKNISITDNVENIDTKNNIVKLENDVNIPNAIQFEKNDNNASILICKGNKHRLIKNNFSPLHKEYTINSFDDFDNIPTDKNFIHLIINNQLSIENKSLLNINIFKINPISIKYTDEFKIEKKDDTINIDNNFNIVNTIYDNITDDNVKKQFDRIVNIYKNTKD